MAVLSLTVRVSTGTAVVEEDVVDEEVSLPVEGVVVLVEDEPEGVSEEVLSLVPLLVPLLVLVSGVAVQTGEL